MDNKKKYIESLKKPVLRVTLKKNPVLKVKLKEYKTKSIPLNRIA